MRNRNDQITFFGRRITTKQLNLASTIFLLYSLFSVGRINEIYVEDATFSETLQIFLIVCLMIYTGCDAVSEIIKLCRNDTSDDVFISSTLQRCINRGKRIEIKLEKLNSVQINVSQMFICPISLFVMNCPVLATDGNLYDFDSIRPWLDEYGVSPITREILDKHVSPAVHLQDQIETWIDEQIENMNIAERNNAITNRCFSLDS